MKLKAATCSVVPTLFLSKCIFSIEFIIHLYAWILIFTLTFFDRVWTQLLNNCSSLCQLFNKLYDDNQKCGKTGKVPLQYQHKWNISRTCVCLISSSRTAVYFGVRWRFISAELKQISSHTMLYNSVHGYSGVILLCDWVVYLLYPCSTVDVRTDGKN